jgi:hypothetical protein
MNNQEQFLYFAQSGTAGDAVTDSGCWPASSLLTIQPSAATTSTLYFKDSTNTAAVNTVVLTHANISADAGVHKKIALAVAKIAANAGRGKVLTVVDTANGVVASEFDGLTTVPTCTAIEITQ